MRAVRACRPPLRSPAMPCSADCRLPRARCAPEVRCYQRRGAHLHRLALIGSALGILGHSASWPAASWPHCSWPSKEARAGALGGSRALCARVQQDRPCTWDAVGRISRTHVALRPQTHFRSHPTCNPHQIQPTRGPFGASGCLSTKSRRGAVPFSHSNKHRMEMEEQAVFAAPSAGAHTFTAHSTVGHV